MDVKEQILQFMSQKGPVLPVQVSKEINSNILMASAHLSELSSNKKIKVSNVKVGGGSPLYYLPGQEPKLQDFSSNLHEKEQKAYALLSQKKVLKDSELEPVVRAALRQIKDFAVPLQVNYKGSTEIFWKWYLLPSSEAELLIKSTVKGPEEPKKEIKKPEKIPEKLQKELKKPKIEKTIEKQETIVKQPHVKIKPTDNFLKHTTDYFKKNDIRILEQNIIRKSSEIEFVVQVPSSVGSLTYFCKAKNKKRINDGDLSSAYIQSQSKKLPVLFLITGELTKKAKEMFEKEFKGMNIKQI